MSLDTGHGQCFDLFESAAGTVSELRRETTFPRSGVVGLGSTRRIGEVRPGAKGNPPPPENDHLRFEFRLERRKERRDFLERATIESVSLLRSIQPDTQDRTLPRQFEGLPRPTSQIHPFLPPSVIQIRSGPRKDTDFQGNAGASLEERTESVVPGLVRRPPEARSVHEWTHPGDSPLRLPRRRLRFSGLRRFGFGLFRGDRNRTGFHFIRHRGGHRCQRKRDSNRPDPCPLSNSTPDSLLHHNPRPFRMSFYHATHSTTSIDATGYNTPS